ncbi:MAG: PAS domain-containing sensor histidine kinase [Candidatus Obscuribacterales bacterium]|nr:PAS domain-containing sensor histidine kinase [Candidatus Obscuribacterales bacterium]
MQSSKNYELLRDWYLARLRSLALEAELSADKTPAGFIAVDKERIKQLAAESILLPLSESKKRKIPVLHLGLAFLFFQLLMLSFLSLDSGSISSGAADFVGINFMPLAFSPQPLETFSEKFSFLALYMAPCLVLSLIPASKLSLSSISDYSLQNESSSASRLELLAALFILLAELFLSISLLQTDLSSASMKARALLLQSLFAWSNLIVFPLLAYCKYLSLSLSRVSSLCNRISGAPAAGSEAEGDLIDRMLSLESQVNELRMRERAIADYSDNVLLSFNSEFKIDSLSPNVLPFWGYQLHELLDCELSRLVFSEDFEALKGALSKCRESEKSGSLDCRIRKNDDSILDCKFYFEWSSRFQKFFAGCRDISDQKNLERLRQDFIAKLTHDMRSPLASVKLVLSAFSENTFGDLPEAAARVISRTQTGLSRVLDLIDEILESEKINSGQLELFLDELRLQPLCLKVIDEQRAVADERNIRLLPPENDLKVTADARLLLRVLSNLLSNAISFSPDRESISIEILSSGNYALIQVSDKGPGVPKELQQTIFQRFGVSTKKSNSQNRISSGLGLSICRDIVRAHGGTIGVKSNPHEGSRFWFTVPLASLDD